MIRPLAILLTLVVLVPAVTGCAVLAPGEGHGGGHSSLDDAIAAARPDTSSTARKARRMDVGESTPPVVSTEVEVAPAPIATSPHVAVTTPKPPRPKSHPLFGLVIGAGFLGGADYDGYATFGLTGGDFSDRRLRWDITASASDVTFKGESRLGQVFLNAFDLELDLTGRYYLTEPHTLMGLSPLIGVGTGTVFWDYARELPVVQDGEEKMVKVDRINHFDLYGGLSLSLLQLRHLHFGGKAIGGVRFYGWHTYQGFDNSAFPTTGFGRILIETTYRL